MSTGPKKKGLVAGSMTYLSANVINAAIPFVLLPILTRYMNPDQYGQVAMYQTLLAALATVTGISAHAAASVKYYDNDLTTEHLGHFIGASFQILMVSSVVIFALMFMARIPLGQWLGLPPSWLLWAVVASASNFIILLRLGQWQVRGEALKYGILQITQSAANAVLSLIMVVVLLRGAEGRIDAQNYIVLAFAFLSTCLLFRDRLVSWSWRPGYIREALSFGIPLIPHTVGIFLLGSVDRMMINSRLGLAPTGIYMVGVQLTTTMGIVFSAINNAYVPWLFERLKRGDPAEKRQIVRWTYGYFVAALLLAGLAFVVGPWAVTLIAGEKYRAAGQVVGWLALGNAFGGMYLMVTNYIFYSKRTGLLSLVTICSGLFNIAMLYILIAWLGITGAAIAFALTAALRFSLTWLVAQRRHPMPWFDSRSLTA
jgi:O-antigen/teichoic acid export membrane protein